MDVSLDRFNELLAHLDKKKSGRSERDFVRQIFARTHSQILKRYDHGAEFHELFETGAYNCLTGTILYSLILDHYGIRHEVIETNYHIFITVQTQQGEILLEATDPLKGFVSTQKEIDARIESYKENQPSDMPLSQEAYKFSFNLYNVVTQQELLGLLYYNLAVKAYNSLQLEKATRLLEKSAERYSTVRTNEFAALLLYGISQSNMNDQEKLLQIRALRSIRNKSMQTLAGL